MTTEYEVIKVKEVKEKNKTFIEKVKKLEVYNQATFNVANSIRKEAKKRIKAIKDRLEPEKKKAYSAYKGWVDLIKELCDPLEAVKQEADKKIGSYLAEQKRIQQEKLKEARRIEEEKRLRDAEVLAQAGLQDEADKIISKRIIVPKDVAPKVETNGTYITMRWRAEVIDIKALAKAVAEGKVLPDLIQPNMSRLNKMAVSLKEKFDVPGVKAISDVSVGSRG